MVKSWSDPKYIFLLSGTLICSEVNHESEEFSHVNFLSVAPYTTIPAPSAVVSDGDPVEEIPIVLSVISNDAL